MPAATLSSSMPSALARARRILVALVRCLVTTVEQEEAAGNPWEGYWGSTYGPELKQWLLKPVFETLESKGKIGDVIVDVGSGAAPVTRFLPNRAGRKRIFVDVAGDNGRAGEEQRVRLDAEKVGDEEALSFRKAAVRAGRFLGVEPRGERECADMIVFSDLLNYVDFRKVLQGFGGFLKEEGRMVIVNLPIRGNEALFSEKGLKDNRELYPVLEGMGFEVEIKAFPKRGKDETDDAQELIVLVARERGSG